MTVSIAYGYINDTKDFSQIATADDTKLDMKDEGHGLYPLIGYFRLAYGHTGVDACTI